MNHHGYLLLLLELIPLSSPPKLDFTGFILYIFVISVDMSIRPNQMLSDISHFLNTLAQQLRGFLSFIFFMLFCDKLQHMWLIKKEVECKVIYV